MGLTQEEFTALYERWEQELTNFDATFSASVENIISQWDTFNQRQAEASTSMIEEINKLQTEIVELTNQQ